MAATIFMSITEQPITGNSEVKAHSGQFELLTLSYSAVNSYNESAGLRGKPTLSPITVTLNAYQGPVLINALATGQTHTVEFFITSGASAANFETIELTNAVLTLFQESVSQGNNSPVFELSFVYEKIAYSQTSNEATFRFDTTNNEIG